MAERKRGKFAQKAKTMFDQGKLTGLADFLDAESEGSGRKLVTTENRKTVQMRNDKEKCERNSGSQRTLLRH